MFARNSISLRSPGNSSQADLALIRTAAPWSLMLSR